MVDKYVNAEGVSKLSELIAAAYQAKENGKGLSTNDFTTALKSKLDGIESGAEVNKIEQVKVNNVALQINDKIINIDLSGYAKKTDITAIYRYKGSCTYAELTAKTDAAVGDVWNVTDKGGTNYACITAKTANANAWDPLGMVIDLTPYMKTADANNTFAAKSHTHSIGNITNLQAELNKKKDEAGVISIIETQLTPMSDEEIASAFN